jgi:hypothetical protein
MITCLEVAESGQFASMLCRPADLQAKLELWSIASAKGYQHIALD